LVTLPKGVVAAIVRIVLETHPTPITSTTPTADLTPKRTRWAVLGGTVAIGAGLGAYILANNPNVSSGYPPCVFKSVTGLDCPGCGGMRCVHSLLQGDIVGAASHNLLAFVLLPVLAYLLVRQLLLMFGRELPPLPSVRYLGWSLAIVALVFTVARNIPGTPLTWLDATA
jgi:hypothetical protein